MSLSNASITRLSSSAPLLAARQMIQPAVIIDRAIAVQQIPAPTFYEKERALYIQGEFQKLGLSQIEMDDLYNVYGWLPADRADAPTLLLSAHTDTVFDANTDLSIRREGDQIFGAGLGDNSLGVAALLTLADLFKRFDIPREAHLCFLANSREEGMGDLGGIRAAVQKLQGRIQGALVLEGMALGRVYHAGIGVRRLRLTVKAPGGHSWLHFGQPSAIHELIRFGNALIGLNVPNNPRTTFNIGTIQGGSSVNTIAAEASCLIDMRSIDTAALQTLESQILTIGDRLTTKDVFFQFELVGDRPSGSIPLDHPLVRLAKESHQAIKMPVDIDAGSTDANVLLATGIPTVCVGISYGGNAHRLDEYIETPPIENGTWQLLLLAAAAANGITAW